MHYLAHGFMQYLQEKLIKSTVYTEIMMVTEAGDLEVCSENHDLIGANIYLLI
jgi:ethanolamine utilization protein EutQ (cupin superfamily)